MFFELVCSCTATFHMESPEEEGTAAWLFAHRFVNAHEDCGYMSPPRHPETEQTRVPHTNVEKD
jgi:hypothetical protein